MIDLLLTEPMPNHRCHMRRNAYLLPDFAQTGYRQVIHRLLPSYPQPPSSFTVLLFTCSLDRYEGGCYHPPCWRSLQALSSAYIHHLVCRHTSPPHVTLARGPPRCPETRSEGNRH